MILYIAGPYSASTRVAVEANIAAAREVALAVWAAGHVALCPHLNTAHFDDYIDLPVERYYDGDNQLLALCNGIVMVPGWRSSKGAMAEHELAKVLGLGIWYYPDIPLVEIK